MLALLQTLLHSFFLQSGWNYERKQGLGFFYSIYPVIRNLHNDSKEMKKNVMLGHLEYFNTNPYLANVVLGVIVRLERENVSREVISKTKEQLSGPLAVFGDMLFFHTLLPLLMVISFYIYKFNENRFLLPSIFFLTTYNIIHFIFRIGGFYYGFRYKLDIINILQKINLQSILSTLNLGGLILTTVFVISDILFFSSYDILYFMFKIVYFCIVLTLRFFGLSVDELLYLTVLSLFILNFIK